MQEDLFVELNYFSIADLLKTASDNHSNLSSLVLAQQAEQMELTEEEVYEKMRENYLVMASCIEPGCAPDLKSTSGLTGGDAYKMRSAVEKGSNLTGSLMGGALYRALAVSELNASMGRIVAAPTAEAAESFLLLCLPCKQNETCQKGTVSCPYLLPLLSVWSLQTMPL